MDDNRSPPRLLVVDDDMVSRSMAAKALRHAGFDVADTDDGEDALRKFAEEPFDLLLLDVMMPGLDGYEVCQRLRALPRGAQVPVLMLTGLNDTESIELAYRSGATDFITKPINWSLLSHRVRYALRASAIADGMRRSQERLENAQQLAKLGSWDLLTDGSMQCSAQLSRLFGAPPESGKPASFDEFLQCVLAKDRLRVADARERLRRDCEPYQIEFQIRGFDGVVRSVLEQATPLPDDALLPRRWQGTTQDVSDRVEAQHRIRQLADYDTVTGLPNRQFFRELAAPVLERARSAGQGCALLYLDIDQFKAVNDAVGQIKGDAVLQAISVRLRSVARSANAPGKQRVSDDFDLVARISSNTFALMVTGITSQDRVAAVAKRALNAVSEPIQLDDRSLILTASIGTAVFPHDGERLDELARGAEQALYAAKGAGRAQHRFYDEQMNDRATRKLALESDLRKAITSGELRVYYQPKVDATTRAIIGAEALVRWQHPLRGLVSPADFIPLAEETGLILPLTDWVLESVCADLREWQRKDLKPVPISVNLAAPSLADAALPERLDRVMARHELQHDLLMLEMTETMLMVDMEQAVARLESLRRRGFKLSLDDFGTGYSSLSYLQVFPMDELKIDRAFIVNAARSGRDGALAVAIITLGRELGLNVVAEGVETEEQSRFLVNHGCLLQQGFLFSRPVPKEEFDRLLRGKALPASIQGGVAAG